MKLLRKIQPLIKQVELGNIPEAELVRLDNGVPLYSINCGEENIMRIDFLFDGGQVREIFPLTASTTNLMFLEGSENYNAKEINSTFDYYGAYINPFTQKDLAGITVFLLNKHIGKITELCHEILFNPVFPVVELENLQKKRLQTYLINRKRVQNLASDRFFESIFGTDHPYGRQTQEADFGNVTRDMLTSFHEEFYKKGPFAIVISGKTNNNIQTILNTYFGRIETGSGNVVSKKVNITGNKVRKGHVIKEDAVQAAIRIGTVTVNKKHPDYEGIMVVDTILGGYFGSRLMKNLREDKGYTYGVHSSLMSLQQSGYIIIATEVGKEHTNKALDEIYNEIRNLQTIPVGKNELDVVKNYMSGELVRMFDGPFPIADSFRAVMEFGMDNGYYYNLAKRIRTIEPDEIMQLAVKYYDIDRLYEIIAGPK